MSWLIGFVAKSALMQSPIGAWLKMVPAWAWKALAIAAALVALVLVHQHYAHKAIAAAKAEQQTADNSRFAKQLAHVAEQANAIRIKAEALSASIAAQERTRHEQDLRRNAADAAALRVRGPGAAASHCGPVDHPGLSASAGGRLDAASGADAAGPALPAGEWATVPWTWLVDRAREHDDLLAEVRTWRSSDTRPRSAWEQMRAQPKGTTDGR
jgi:hypothetical protein